MAHFMFDKKFRNNYLCKEGKETDKNIKINNMQTYRFCV